MNLDVLIKNARIVDGTGAPWFLGSIGLRGSEIALVDRNPAGVSGASLEIDAKGRTVTPGFLDIHRHSDWTLLVAPAADSALEQGLTTEVIGNCGYGPAPAVDRRRVTQNILGYSARHGRDITWTSFGEFLDVLDSGLGVNVVPLVAHGPVRTSAMGVADRHATDEELDSMSAHVAEAMEAGAFGLSSGLEYPPYITASTTKEMIRLCSVVARYGGFYATHVRERVFGVEAAVDEAIDIARQSGVRLQVSHITGRVFVRHATQAILAAANAARDEGMDVAFDTYPYEWGPGPMYELLPSWAVDGPAPEVAARFRDPAFRTRVQVEHRQNLVRWVQLERWDKIIVVSAPDDPDVVGKDLATISRVRGQTPWEVVFDVLAKAGEAYPEVVQIAHSLDWDDIELTIRDPLCSIGSDAVTLSRTGVLAAESVHPGSYGFVPRALTEILDRRLLTFEEAVRRMTSLPASQLGVWDRGLIRPGLKADLVVLDRSELRDNTTWTDFNARPSGIDVVLVNGQVAVQDGVATGRRAGSVLRKQNQRLAS